MSSVTLDGVPPLPRHWKIAILSAACLAFLCKILLALTTYGTNDVYAWERFARWSALFGGGLYRADPAFNHPPAMVHVLRALTWLAKNTGIPFAFWLRLPAILADTASLCIVSRIFARRLNEPAIRWALLLLAISPILILVSGFHGNTDPVVMVFVLVSVWLTEKGASDWASGAAFGAAMCVKVLPLAVLPVLLFYRRGYRRRTIFVGASVAAMLLCWAPYLYRDPAAVIRQVFGYQSLYGHWGLSWLAYHLTFFRDSWHDAFRHLGAYVVLAVIAVAGYLENRFQIRRSLYAQVGLSLFFFLAVSNGFGVQYLAWLVPWTVGLGVLPITFFTLASGSFLFLVYNYWSGGFPWYLADGNFVGDFTPHLDYFLTVCWLSVAVLAWSAWKPLPLALPSPKSRHAFGVLLVLFLFYPMWQQFRLDARKYPPAVDQAAITSIYSNEHAMLSQQYYKLGRYAEAVVAARIGVGLDPSQLDAWNNLAKACLQLGRWDEAINAANQAVRIAPEDEAANYNLSQALSHR